MHFAKQNKRQELTVDAARLVLASPATSEVKGVARLTMDKRAALTSKQEDAWQRPGRPGRVDRRGSEGRWELRRERSSADSRSTPPTPPRLCPSAEHVGALGRGFFIFYLSVAAGVGGFALSMFCPASCVDSLDDSRSIYSCVPGCQLGLRRDLPSLGRACRHGLPTGRRVAASGALQHETLFGLLNSVEINFFSQRIGIRYFKYIVAWLLRTNFNLRPSRCLIFITIWRLQCLFSQNSKDLMFI